MNAAGSNIWQTGVWLIPFILLAIIGGLYLLSRYYERKTQKGLKKLRGQLRRLQSDRKGLEHTLAGYSLEDPEPYGSHVEALLVQLDQIGEQVEILEHRHVNLQESTRSLTLNRWRSTLGAPFLWRPLRMGIQRMQMDLEAAGGSLEAASTMQAALTRISWKIALQARDAQRQFQKIRELMEALRTARLGGQAFEAAIHLEGEARVALALIPDPFLEADQTSLVEIADIESTARVYEILGETCPLLDELLDQAQTWEEQYIQASDQLAMMRHVLDEFEKTIDNLPEEFEISDFRNQIGGLQVIAQNLEATQARLEVDGIELVSQESTRITQIARDAVGQLKRARREYAALENVLDELSEGLKKLPLKLATLGAKSVHPIEWEESIDKLTGINRRAQAIGPLKASRTPEKVQQDLALATTLRGQLIELTGHCQQVEAAYIEFTTLFNTPEIKGLNEWLLKTQRLVEQVHNYAPENWPRTVSIPDLQGDMDDLEKEVSRLLPENRARPIPENDVTARLEGLRKLSQSYEQMKARMDTVQGRLEDLKATEKTALETLTSTQALLTQVIYIIGSNAFLSEVAEGEAKRLQNDLQNLLNELEQPQRGSIDKTSKRVTMLVAKIEQTGNQWLDKLNRDIQDAIGDLSAILTHLDSIAQFDEGAVVEARRLLSSGHAFDMDSYQGKSRLRLENLVQEFKGRSDYWQTCAAAIKALQDMEAPVIESYEQANFERESTQKRLTEVSAWLRQNRAWPPTSVDMNAERREMEDIDAQWKSLKDKRNRAIILVQELGGLSARYQTLAQKIDQSAVRAEQEMAQVEELEVEIEELAQLWENQWYAHRDNPVANQEIRDLLDSVEHDGSSIRKEFKRRAMDHSQVLEALKALQRQVKFYQAALDEDHALDANGRINTRR